MLDLSCPSSAPSIGPPHAGVRDVAPVAAFEYGNGHPSQAVVTTRSTPDSGLGADDRGTANQERQRPGYNPSGGGGEYGEVPQQHHTNTHFSRNYNQLPMGQGLPGQQFESNPGYQQAQNFPRFNGRPQPHPSFREDTIYYSNNAQNVPSLMGGLPFSTGNVAGPSHGSPSTYGYYDPHHYAGGANGGRPQGMNGNGNQPSGAGYEQEQNTQGHYYQQQQMACYQNSGPMPNANGPPGPQMFVPHQMMMTPGGHFQGPVLLPPNQFVMMPNQNSQYQQVMSTPNGQQYYMGVPPIMVQPDQHVPHGTIPPLYRVPQGPPTTDQGPGVYAPVPVAPSSGPYVSSQYAPDGRMHGRLSTAHVNPPNAPFSIEATAFIPSTTPRGGGYRRSGRFNQGGYTHAYTNNYQNKGRMPHSRNGDAKESEKVEEITTRLDIIKVSNSDSIPDIPTPSGYTTGRGKDDRSTATGKVVLELADRASKSVSPPQEPVPSPPHVESVNEESDAPKVPVSTESSKPASRPSSPVEAQLTAKTSDEVQKKEHLPPAPAPLQLDVQPVLPPKICSYCRGTRKVSPEEYTGHIFRGPDNKVECPRAREDLVCNFCGNKGGEYAHSIMFCPKKKAESAAADREDDNSSRSTSRSTPFRGSMEFRPQDRQKHRGGRGGGSYRGGRGSYNRHN